MNPHSSYADRLDRFMAWARSLHVQLSPWARSLSWKRLAALFVLSLIAAQMIMGVFHTSRGGFLSDLMSAFLMAFFAYLVATKIIDQKTADADAAVRSATDLAEQETMKRQLVQARLKLLQAQIEPHFLFNTLAAVDYLIETDPARASVMQKTLIAYLRAALPQMREGSSLLGREFNLIKPYLELLKMRIEERLEFSFNVPVGLYSAVFPPMMLQSLVENAIQHGIEPKPDGGRITVSAMVCDGQLWVEVEDSGIGLPDPNAPRASTSGTGLGLANIRDRLAMLYPGSGRLDLLPSNSGGTLARIVIPYQVDLSAQTAGAPKP
jgi:sensor histidine kinase YesM